MNAPGRHELERTRCGQTRSAAAPGDAHEQGFRDIVLLVPQPKGADTTPGELALKKRKTRRARLRLAGLNAGLGPFTADKPHTQRGADTCAKPCIGSGRPTAQAMVKMQSE